MKRSFAILALLSVLFFIGATFCYASEEAGVDTEAGSTADTADDEPAFEIPDDAALMKMKVRQLKEILGRKGPDADCLACTSKREYVDRIRETESWPDVTPTPPPPPPPEMSKEEMDEFLKKTKDPEYMADLRKKLEEAGIDTNNIFMGNDLDPEKLKKFAADGKENAPEDDKSQDESSDEKPNDAAADDEL